MITTTYGICATLALAAAKTTGILPLAVTIGQVVIKSIADLVKYALSKAFSKRNDGAVKA